MSNYCNVSGNLEIASKEASDGTKTCCSTPSNGIIFNIFDRVNNIGKVAEKTLASSETIQSEMDILLKTAPLISDMQNQFSDERISLMADEISKGVSSNCKDTLDPPLTAIRDLQYQILEQQAKADVVEKQFLALADEILPRIKELKAIEESLIAFCEKSLDPIQQNSNELSSTDSRKAIKLVVQLNSLIKHVEKSQQQILKQGNDTIEHQETMSKICNKILPISNSLQEMLKNSFDYSFLGLDVAGFLKGCKQLNRKITELGVLDVELRSLTKNDGRSDLQQLLQKSISLRDNIDSAELISKNPFTTECNETADESLGKKDTKQTSAVTNTAVQCKPEYVNPNAKPVCIQKHKAPKTTSGITSGPIKSNARTQRTGKVNLTKMCSSANALRPKYISSSVNKEVNPPSRARKRLSSSSADDSIADTNSEAQDHGDTAVESSVTKQLSGKMTAADRIGRPNWGPKRKRPCYDGIQATNEFNGEASTITLPGEIM